MWIVRLALRRPYTFVVMSMLIAMLGVVTILRMPTDIFPEVDIPVIAVIWNYTGISPDEMEKRFVSNYERALTTTVNDIEHIESMSIYGVSVTKVFFYPTAKIEAATAQVTAISQTMLRQFPPGATPPGIFRYNATNVPILQATLGSDTLTEQQLFDNGANFLRGGLAVVQGAQIPWPYGGKQRQIQVDLDPDKMFALKVSPTDVSDAINAQNLILPAGTAKIGQQEYSIRLNSSPSLVDQFNELPIAVAGGAITPRGATIFVKDVAHVRDGFSPQTNIVHIDGKRGVLMSILKSGGASTLDIVARVREALPSVLATLTKELRVSLIFDQSVFVRAAVSGVVKEAAIAAGLTALMIMLFLGSWRSTLIVVISIPLSILVSIILLDRLGQTLNVMTLGGMALAVGILVDDATVELENIHRNLGEHKELVPAILDGARQIAVPAFVSTTCICIVFVPVVFIAGAARSLFTPLALAVVFAMMTSYLLSRTLVPTMVHFLLQKEVTLYGGKLDDDAPEDPDEHRRAIRNPIWRVHQAFNRQFEKLRRVYGGWLALALAHRGAVVAAFGFFVVISGMLLPILGRDFFPSVDAGQLRLHVRCPPGMRIEETEKQFARVESAIREMIPADEVVNVLDNIGIPYSGINLAFGDPSMVSPADGEILISLTEHHAPTPNYVRRLRRELPSRFPELTIFFLPPDIATQILNFGLSAPIDVQVVGPIRNQEENLKIAKRMRDAMAKIPGAVDVHLHQEVGVPELHLDVDRTMAERVGLSQRDVANNLLISLSSSGQASPNFWLSPQNGVQYNVAVQTPQSRITSTEELENLSISTRASSGNDAPQLLGNLATLHRGTGAANITHYNNSPTFDVLASVEDMDLGSVAAGVDKVIAGEKKTLPRGSTIVMRGQAESMRASFTGLGYGLLFAIVLVYLLMVVNFQSWLDPLIILMALPGALAGILWMLFSTGTTLSVPALMGAIMSIGVATANAILLITFANDQRLAGMSAHDAALSAGITRLRPVLMTALAMIIGMLPMSLGLGEGGEQNAPLGRAVIGGLTVATFATLFFVPIAYSTLRKKAPNTAVRPELA